MKKLFTIIGIIASAFALVLAVLPVSNLAFIPAIAALLFGILAYVINRENQSHRKTIQLVFLLTFIALCVTIYKAIFTEIEVGDTKELEKKEQESIEEAKEQLEDQNLQIEPIEDIDTSNDF